MSSVATLLAEVQGCTSCAEHVPLGPRPILQWNPRARILSAGQAPDRKGQESGKPFADGNGDRLGEWLGMTRELFYDAKQVAIQCEAAEVEKNLEDQAEMDPAAGRAAPARTAWSGW